MRRIREQVIWYRTKRLAAAHPFFHRKNGLLSMSEAKALLRGREIRDGHAVLRQARIELGIPEPVSGAATSPGKTFCNTVIRGHSFSLRKGLGAGADPEVGKAAAEENREELTELVKGA